MEDEEMVKRQSCVSFIAQNYTYSQLANQLFSYLACILITIIIVNRLGS